MWLPRPFLAVATVGADPSTPAGDDPSTRFARSGSALARDDSDRDAALTHSLIPQRYDRTEAGAPPGGPDAEQDADHRREHEGGGDRQRRDDGVPLEEGAHRRRASAADEGADETTEQAEHDGLD